MNMEIGDIKKIVKEALKCAIDDLNIAYDSLCGFKFPEYYLTSGLAKNFTDVIEEDYLDYHGKYLICCFIGIKKG